MSKKTTTRRNNKQPYVIVDYDEDDESYSRYDYVCFFEEGDKRIGCGKVVAIISRGLLVKVNDVIKPRLAVGMAAGRSAAGRGPPPPSGLYNLFRDLVLAVNSQGESEFSGEIDVKVRHFSRHIFCRSSNGS